MEFVIPFPQLLVGLLGIPLLYHLYRVLCNYNQRRGTILAPIVPGAWPILGHLLQLDPNKPIWHTFGDIADKHGAVVMIKLGMKNSLIVSSWEAAKECFTTNDLALATRPNTSVGRYLAYDNAMFAVAPFGEYWQEMKIKLTKGELISPRTLELVKHQRFSEIEAFIKELYCLSKDQSATVVMSEMLMNLAINIMSKTINGRRIFNTFAGAADDEGRTFVRVLNEFQYAEAQTVVADLIPYPFSDWLDPQGFIKLMKRIAKDFDSILQGWIDEHRKRRSMDGPRSDQDFIDFTLSAIENGSVSSEHATATGIKSTYVALIIAGTSTIPITVIWALCLLLNDEHALKCAQEELDRKIGRDRWVEESDVKTLDYLQAIIYETLRLYPPGPLGFPHEAREDCSISGYHIPKGTFLFLNFWKVHRDSRIWTDPDKFMPERFLTSHETYDASKYHFQCIPFGLGRRSCPGMPLAQRVMHLLLARILQGFNLSRPTDMPVDMSEKNGVVLHKALPLEVTITPRLHPKLY
ncbi:hypothetical protein Ancab_039651 [Ancistrocladus abbreviatus]